jgi:hypothetical protein
MFTECFLNVLSHLLPCVAERSQQRDDVLHLKARVVPGAAQDALALDVAELRVAGQVRSEPLHLGFRI